ncbi:hypothetical protein MH928_13470 [Flavobacterium sp. WW92]|uniref:HNH endonuclease domain-containing protein n=1 Tax=unclassified Flavobacterium TaxID=196869 RepID=UPI002224C3E0|nr:MULTISPECIES: HNH endonuclease domain-containing protein [unclassified Flavobacterium]WDO12329.1 hypothetical protein MH928_13470 [Flavobacterium sp. WW92]
MSLPSSSLLNVNKLSSVFNNTSATYKYYWLLSIIETVEQGKRVIAKKELFASMLANAWYTVNYFHVSFGGQDMIQQAIGNIVEIEMIPIIARKDHVVQILLSSDNKKTIALLNHFDKNVPHWFLTPWVSKNKGENYSQYQNRIYTESQRFHNQSLYALYSDRIEVNPMWLNYLKSNARILKDFCYWNLSNFLQVRNPNVPDIPGKLIKPPMRGSLTNQRKNYWDVVFRELGTVDCIYTDTKLSIQRYALDHFVPHAFVSHDLMWNLVPIDTVYNSIKSDKLPSMDIHFDKFYDLQKTAFEIVSKFNSKSKLLEEYFYLFNLSEDKNNFCYDQLKNTISPLISIAANNGFQYYQK